MVQNKSSRTGQQTTRDPQREAAGPLPLLRTIVELPESLGVLPRGEENLAEVAQPSLARHPHVVGEVQQPSVSPSLAEAANQTPLGQCEESSMRGCWPASESGHIDIAEEPAALIGHGGVCEGGGSCRVDRASSTRRRKLRSRLEFVTRGIQSGKVVGHSASFEPTFREGNSGTHGESISIDTYSS